MTARDSRFDDEGAVVGVRVTWEQFGEINRRAGLNVFDGRARSEYMVGYLFGEPRDELLERVHRIAAEDRARFRAELAEDRARRAARRAQREGAPHSPEPPPLAA
jgi:hypothetical protein